MSGWSRVKVRVEHGGVRVVLPAGSRCRPAHQTGPPVGRYTAAAQSTGEGGRDSNEF